MPLKAATLFRKNAGQWPAKILFAVQAQDASIAFLANGIEWTRREAGNIQHYSSLFANARPHLLPKGEGKSKAKIRYLQGCHSPIHTQEYARIRYTNVWPGIDVVYYTAKGQLKYDLEIQANAAPEQIRIAMSGLKNLQILPNGSLQIQTKTTTFHEAPPYTYQEKDGKKEEIASRYSLNQKGEVQFEFPNGYDKNRKLIIDPVVLEWGTYVRSANPSNGFMADFVIDESGNIYAIGNYNGGFGMISGTDTHNFSTQGVDLVIYKLDSSGSNLIWATYLGGSRSELGKGIARDPNGNIYLTGQTHSTDFPGTSGAFQPVHGDGVFLNSDVFVAKLSPEGDSLQYATYFGGLGDDFAGDIDVNAAGEAFIGGYTNGGNIPTTNGAYDQSFNGAPGFSDIFVFRLSADATSLIYSTYLGGTQSETITTLIVNDQDEASFSGEMNSPDYPTTPNALYTRNTGPVGAYVTRISADGSSLLASTYLAGNNADYGEGMALNKAGDFFITGRSYSTLFPFTSNTYDSTNHGDADIFMARISADATQLQYSTFLGGTGRDIGTGIALNELGEIFITGNTTSPDFPTTVCTIDSTNAGGNAYWGGDIFLVKFDSSGERLLYSTLIGGAGDEAHAKLALDNAACTRGVIIGANSDSPDFPTTADGFMPTNPGATTQHAFIRLKEELNVRIILPPDSCPKAGEAFVLSPEIDGCGHWTDFRKLEWSFGDGVVVWDTAPSHAYSGNGNYTVQVRKPGCSEVLDEQVLNLFALDLGPDLEICPGQDIILDASIAQASSYLWHDGLTTATHQVDKAGLLFVTATDARGCSASDTVKVNLLTQDNVQIPNIFTPNGDGINDKFFVTGLGDTAWHLQVFDRWGKLRLSDTAYQNDWQGDQLPEGVYYYILKSRLTCGTFIGHVTLMR